MLTPVYTRQFQKDLKRNKKRGKNLEKFKIVARTLLEGKPLDPIHRTHKKDIVLTSRFQNEKWRLFEEVRNVLSKAEYKLRRNPIYR